MADEMDDAWGSEEKDTASEGKAPEDQAAETAAASAEDRDPEGAVDMSALPQSEDEPADVESQDEVIAAAPVTDSSLVDAAPAASPEAKPKTSAEPAAAAVSATAYPETFQESSSRGDGGATSRPRGGWERPAPPASNSGPSAMDDLARPGLDLLYDVELDATLQFGSKEMLLRDVLELGPGDVVELDRHIAEPVDLVVGDRIVARGEVVVASGNFALRVTEVATPQMRLESIRCLF